VRIAAAWLLICASGIAADAVSVQWECPDGWRQEKIELPPSFAPAMTLKGVEEIRFAPGMFQADSDSFFSYVLVLCLPDAGLPDKDALHRELGAYYRGLAAAVAKGRGRTIDVDAFQLTLTAKSGDPPQPGIREWTGTLKWTEPFVTGTEQTLHLEIRAGKVGDSDVYVSMCASPSTPGAAIWEKLRDVRDTARFSAPGQ